MLSLQGEGEADCVNVLELFGRGGKFSTSGAQVVGSPSFLGTGMKMLLPWQGGRAVGSSGVFDHPESRCGLLLRSWEGVPSVFEVAVRGGGGLGGLEGSIVGAGNAAATGGEGKGGGPVGAPAEGLAAEEGDEGRGGLEVDDGAAEEG